MSTSAVDTKQFTVSLRLRLVELTQFLLQGGDPAFRTSLGLPAALKAGGHMLLPLLEPLDAVLELITLRREALLLLLGLLEIGRASCRERVYVLV